MTKDKVIEDQVWLEENKAQVEQAHSLLTSYLGGKSAPDKVELHGARTLIDQANAIADRMPEPVARKAKRRVYRVKRSGTKALGAQLRKQAQIVADGLAEALEYDSNMDRLVDAIAEQSNISTDRAEKVAAAEVAKLVGTAIKRRFG